MKTDTNQDDYYGDPFFFTDDELYRMYLSGLLVRDTEKPYEYRINPERLITHGVDDK